MSFIIGKSCVDCMDTACASACPVDCIHGPIDMERSGGENEKITTYFTIYSFI